MTVFVQSSELDITYFTCSEALNYIKTYYKVVYLSYILSCSDFVQSLADSVVH